MDIAQLGFAVDTGGLKDGKASLDALVPAAERADKSSAKLSATLAKVDASADKLMAAANGLSSAVEKMSSVLDKSGRSATTTAAAQGVLSTAVNKVSVTLNGVTTAANGAQTATTGVASASSMATGALNGTAAAAAATGAQFEQLDAHMIAYRANLRQMKVDAMSAGTGTQQLDAHMIAYRNHLDMVATGARKAGQAIRFTGQDGLNATRQLADIGVTAAMGMSPFMIAIQQGPQLLDILQNRATQTGATIGAVFRAAGVAIWTALAPLLPFIIGIGVVIGVVAAAFGLASRKITNDVGDVTKSMDLSTNQAEKLRDHLDRLKDKKINVEVTGGDTFKAFFKTIGEYIGGSDTFKGLRDGWKATLDWLTENGIAWVKMSVGIFAGGVNAILATWQNFPAAIGDLLIQAANFGIDSFNALIVWVQNVPAQIEAFFNAIPAFFSRLWSKAVNFAHDALVWLVDKAAEGVNYIKDNWYKLIVIIPYAIYEGVKEAAKGISWLINKIIEGLNSLGGHFKNADFGHFDNPFAGAAAKTTATGAKAFVQGYNAAGDAIDRFGARWEANAKKIAQQRVLTAVGPAGKEPKTPKGPKTDAAKFEDIVTGAQNDIAVQKARADAVQLSAEAAATLEQKTKLLNEAQSKGITLTDAMRTKIDELAAAYGKAKTAADEAIALKAILKGADADIAGLRSQAEMIGLVGRQLAYQTEMQKLLNEAKAKGLTVDAAMRSQFEGKANQFADQSQANAHDQFMNDVAKGSEERMVALQAEKAQIGLNADEVTRLRIENELLAQARQKNIDLTPADLAAISQVSKEQADVENAIRKTREALDFAKDTAKGFFKDIVSGLQQGKTLWQSFADAAVNALNKIIDKLLDKAIDAAINAIFSAIGGFSDGGVFSSSGVQLFAKGGTFTNSVVDKPTMFASGGALGVMGEAGPEAIVPLKRGSDGALGVQMHGANGGGTIINAPVTIQNDNRVTGAVSSADIVALQRSSAEQTKAQLSRDIPRIIQEYQRDGARV